MDIALVLDCGLTIHLCGDGEVLLPEEGFGSDPISLSYLETVLAKLRALNDFQAGLYVPRVEHDLAVDNSNRS